MKARTLSKRLRRRQWPRRNAPFPSPFSVATPAGAEGWEELYPYYLRFSEDERELEDEPVLVLRRDAQPEPIYPFDTIMVENWWVSLQPA